MEGWASPLDGRDARFSTADSSGHALVSADCRWHLYWHPRAFPLPRVLVDPLAYVQHELRRRARDPFGMRYVVERPPQLGMILHVLLDVVQPLAGRFQHFFELSLGLDLGFTQGHLHTAVRVHFALA